MRLTERDQRLIKWVNSCGYVSVVQVAAFLGVDFSTAARRIRILREAGLLARECLPLSSVSLLVPTRLGVTVAEDDLAPIAGIRPGDRTA